MAKKGTGKKDIMMRGSLYTLKRKCGKRNCKCQKKGELHEGPALSWSVAGRMRIITLTEEDVPMVRAAIERYREAKDELEAEALRGIETLRSEIKQRRASGGGHR